MSSTLNNVNEKNPITKKLLLNFVSWLVIKLRIQFSIINHRTFLQNCKSFKWHESYKPDVNFLQNIWNEKMYQTYITYTKKLIINSMVA